MLAPAAQNAAYGARQTIQVRALEPGQVYDFSVRHEGLDGIANTPCCSMRSSWRIGLAHKLGWGKPMGFGSVQINR